MQKVTLSFGELKAENAAFWIAVAHDDKHVARWINAVQVLRAKHCEMLGQRSSRVLVAYVSGDYMKYL